MRLLKKTFFNLLNLILNFFIVSATKIFAPEESPNLFEGDIKIPKEEQQENLEKKGPLDEGLTDVHLWENGTVPFEISSIYNETERDVIIEAMKTISRKTCIRFVPHGEEQNWIVFSPGTDCSSLVGKRNENGGQKIILDRDGCIQIGVIMHEILHALGLWHEQNRFDRDDHVKIHRDNIIPASLKNFVKHTRRIFLFPYDYDSIMHYGEKAFSKNNKTTIKAIVEGQRIGQRTHLSSTDIRKINFLYKCYLQRSHWTSALFPLLLRFYLFAGDLLLIPQKQNNSSVQTKKLANKLHLENTTYGQDGAVARPNLPDERKQVQRHILTIPYTISGIDKPWREKLQAAMVEISHKTCIKLQPRDNEEPFISIRNNNNTKCRGDEEFRERKGKTNSTRNSTCLNGSKRKPIGMQHLLSKAIDLWHGHTSPHEEIVLDISDSKESTGAWDIHRPLLNDKAVWNIKRKYCRKLKSKIKAE